MNHNKLSILIIAEEVNYNRTSGGLVNAKIIYTLAASYHCEVLTQGHVPNDFGNIFSGKLIHFDFIKSRYLKLISSLLIIRRVVASLTGINHASYHKYLNWKREIKRLPVQHYDLVVLLGTGMGYYAHQAWVELSIDNKPPVIMVIHDPYPMALLPPPYTAPWDRHERKLAKRFSLLISECRQAWSSSLRQLEWMYETYPLLKEKGYVIPHLAIKMPFANTVEADEMLAQLRGLHTREWFLLVHMGSLLQGRDPQYLFAAFEKWLKNNPEALAHSRMIFIGKVHSSLLPVFKQYANSPGFLCYPELRVSYQDALSIQSAATANIILESLEKNSPQLFGKFADAVLANRAILSVGPELSEARRLLGKLYPFQATNGSVDEIYEAIDQLYKTWLLNKDIELPQKDLQAAFQPERMLEAVDALFK